MSTDHQRYSIDYQKSAIGAYAAQNGFNIVRSYIDPGKSGVRIERRDALKQLLNDVQSGQPAFCTILVYDVSRWGRFQDFDESAHYEFICKRAGVPVVYCAEQFENDGTVVAQIIKNLKRAMAGEFSRELSVKVHEGHRKSFLQGHFQGGIAPYAFRRMLVDERRSPRGLLKDGERRHFETDNVILVPGPKQEQDTVRRIFRLFVRQRMPREHIADLLNSENLLNARQRPWRGNQILRILRNEKYVGNLVYGLTAQKLLGTAVRTPQHSWLRITRAHAPIVDRDLFDAAQSILDNPWWYYTDSQMLDYLTAAFCVQGHLTTRLLNESKFTPAGPCYHERFGSISEAYRLIGYKQTFGYPKNRPAIVPRVHRDLICRLISCTENGGGTAKYDERRKTLKINQTTDVGVVVIPYTEPRTDVAGWTLHNFKFFRGDVIFAARLNRKNSRVLDYYLLPRSVCPGTVLRFTRQTFPQYRPFKLRSPSLFYQAYGDLVRRFYPERTASPAIQMGLT
ncbi:MAG: recombinase family protein [Proteobacteria bacterium]|nr:recombinase family protein [Pseudomonadota bacterium]